MYPGGVAKELTKYHQPIAYLHHSPLYHNNYMYTFSNYRVVSAELGRVVIFFKGAEGVSDFPLLAGVSDLPLWVGVSNFPLGVGFFVISSSI